MNVRCLITSISLMVSVSAHAFPGEDPIYRKSVNEGWFNTHSIKAFGDAVVQKHLAAHNLKHGIASSEANYYPTEKYYYGMRTALPTAYHAYAFVIGEKARFYRAIIKNPYTMQCSVIECVANKVYGADHIAKVRFGKCVSESTDMDLRKAIEGISVQAYTH